MPLPNSIEAIIRAQLETAQKYEAMGGYYPPQVINDIRSAAIAAQDAITKQYDAGKTQPALLAQAVRSAREAWLELNEDEDGYGGATFHEIAAALSALSGG
jgi:hypothetical protein